LCTLALDVYITADQVQTAGLVQECTMFRDGLVRLPDAFTVGDFTVSNVSNVETVFPLHSPKIQ